MVSGINSSLIAKNTSKQFIKAKSGTNALKDLCYIPEWFIKRDKIGTYEDFMEKFKQHYSNLSLKKFVLYIQKNAKKIGEGRSSDAYEIPNIDDYIIKIDKEISINFFKYIKDFKKVPDEFYGFNFGQAVADNGDGISVHMRAEGKTYGIKDWVDCHAMMRYPQQEEVDNFINHDMKQLSEFPQESFDDFMKRISFVFAKTRSFFDFLNPNNFIIDYQNKKINIVDVSPKNEAFLSNYGTMVNALCDREFLSWASEDAWISSDKYIKAIVDKCCKASNKYAHSFSSKK